MIVSDVDMINLNDAETLRNLKKSGAILSKTLQALKENLRTGTRLRSVDQLASALLKEYGAEPAFLGYHASYRDRPYPASICTSLNSTVVHGIPGDHALKNGDVIKIDIGVKYRGLYTDAAFTAVIGQTNLKAKRLVNATEEALNQAIKAVKPGGTIGDIGWIIQAVAKKNKLKVIDGLTGHGTGLELHAPPAIPNTGRKGTGAKLEPGMVLAIEPMFSLGASRVIQAADGSFSSEDGSLTAHFEHTVLVTQKGCEVLTK